MSSDEADEDLLDLLRKHLGLVPQLGPPDTGVLRDAEFVADNAVDVALSMRGTRGAARTVWAAMRAHGVPSAAAATAAATNGEGGADAGAGEKREDDAAEKAAGEGYTAAAWRAHELHPDPAEGERTAEFIFAMDLLNFCFWSEKPEAARFAVEYRGRRWTGYWSLVAALRRALDEGSCVLFQNGCGRG
jgi:hypothetical protein